MSGGVTSLIASENAMQQGEGPMHSAYLLPADREQDASMLPSIPVMAEIPEAADPIGVPQGPSAAVLVQLRKDIAIQLSAAQDIHTDAKHHEEVSRLQNECMELQNMYQDAMDTRERARVIIKKLRRKILEIRVEVPVPVLSSKELASYKFRELLMQKLEAEDRMEMQKRPLSVEPVVSAEHKPAKPAKRRSTKAASLH